MWTLSIVIYSELSWASIFVVAAVNDLIPNDATFLSCFVLIVKSHDIAVRSRRIGHKSFRLRIGFSLKNRIVFMDFIECWIELFFSKWFSFSVWYEIVETGYLLFLMSDCSLLRVFLPFVIYDKIDRNV